MFISDEVRINHLADFIKNNKKEGANILKYMNIENKSKIESILGEKKIKEVHKKKEVEIKKRVITVFNNPRFISELCVSLSKTYKKAKIGIIDSNRFSANLDIFLNSKSHIKSVYTQLDVSRSTGLNMLIDGLKKNILTSNYMSKIALNISGYKNVDFFSGSYLIEDYEYYNLNDYKAILDSLKQNYDILLISVNDFLYDAFTIYSLIFSDINIIPLHSTIHAIKKYKSYFEFLEKKQDINGNKNFYVLFNDKNINMEKSVIDYYLKNQYIGYIPYDSKREGSYVFQYRPTKHMKKSIQRKYIALLNKCEV